MEKNKVRDRSGDKKYFTITPRIVWALSRSPYDYMLWNVIKDIAGDDGECILSTEDLATLSMMSAGKVTDCRKHLLKVGLLEGETQKSPEYQWPIWHLTIPDLWELNTKTAKSIPSLKNRIEFKKNQKFESAINDSCGEGGISSCGEETPHQVKKYPSPHEETPHHMLTKKNHSNIQKKEYPEGEGEKPPTHQNGFSKKPAVSQTTGAQKKLEYNPDILANPENYTAAEIRNEAGNLAEKYVQEVFAPAWTLKTKQPYIPTFGDVAERMLAALFESCISRKINIADLFRARLNNFFNSNTGYYRDRRYSLKTFCEDFNTLTEPKHDKKQSSGWITC